MGEKKQKILIVDDAWMNREILSSMLEDEYEILEAENGKEAVDILNSCYSELSLVLLDMNMPEMNGEEVLKIMKGRMWLDRVPVICISSDSTDATVRKAYELGVTDYFSRPFDAAIVKRRVHNTILLYDKNRGDLDDAIGVLAVFFYRILKINLKTGSYLVYKDGIEDAAGRFDEISNIRSRLESFAWKGYVHEEDKEVYLKFCDIDRIRGEFTQGKDHLMLHYRRNINGEFKWVSMELFRSSEYTEENPVIFLYVRDINDEYLKQLDVVMRRTRDAMGMVSMNITKGVCIASSMRDEKYKLLNTMESIESYIARIVKYIVYEDDRRAVSHLSRRYLLKCYMEGKTTIYRDFVIKSDENADFCMVRGTIEMIRNTVSEDIEGILHFTDITGIYLAEKMTSMLYQRNFDQVVVIDSKKRNMLVDTPEKFSIGNYRNERINYDSYIQNELLKKIPKRERESLQRHISLERICRELETKERYSFVVSQEENGEIRMKSYTFVYLSRQIGVILGAAEDITEDSRRDILTDGYNRQGFIEYSGKILRESRPDSQYAICFFDIHNFKAVNELFGMENGDFILKEMYKQISASGLKPLVTARVESDHFTCLVDRKNMDFGELGKLCKIKIADQQRTFHVSMSCGIFYISKKDENIGEMADKAKVAKNYIEDEYAQPWKIYDESMKDDYVDKARVIDGLKNGIDKGEFLVYYQPIVCAKTGEIVSAEALVRWKHPREGFISPAVFIPVLEEKGHITELDRYVAGKVKELLVTRKKAGRKIVPVSVNLSWMDFYDEKLMTWLGDSLEECRELDIPTRVEITETSLAAISQDRNPVLNTLREKGADLLMDDFGTGYASFGILQDYKFDILKLDRSFIRQIETNKKTRGILEALIDMGHKLDMRLVAEGAETLEQVEFLRKNGCDYIQGYYYYRPMPESEFCELLE